MDYIPRKIESALSSRLFSGKALILYGPRQSGKTTLLKKIMTEQGDRVLWMNGESPDIRLCLEGMTVPKWNSIIGGKRIVIIDEAQCIPDIGRSIKLLVDECPAVQVVATGSSAFELAQRTSEPLTGRKFEFTLLPLSFQELVEHGGLLDERRRLEERLLYGAYPEIVTAPPEERQVRLAALSGSYLYKDILMMEGVKRPALLEKIVRALALQLGSEVSASELSRLVGADIKTVEKYLDMLEKCYVIFRLPAFSRNERTEIRKGRKFYFYDLGIRNAVLGNFTPLHARTDTGGMWENYLVLERMKRLAAAEPFPPRCYFWRTTGQQEVDYLEESPLSLSAWEFKWQPKAVLKFPKLFKAAYPEAMTAGVTPDNYDAFLL
jgi:hypothetical protein